jgi:phage gpG-like protein
MIRIEFNIAALSAQMDKASQALGDLTPINEDIGEYVIEATRERFRSSTAPDGTRWRAKQPATIARYLARGDGNRPKPLIGPSGRLSKEIAKVVSRDQVEVGSALEYSGVMQGGAAKGAFGKSATGQPLPWGDIPARVWLGLSDTDERNIIAIVDEHLASATGGERA